MSGTVLRVRGLSVSLPPAAHPRRLVSGVGFDLAPGEIVGLVGESGSGKTVTASALLGLVPGHGVRLDVDELRLAGRDLRTLNEHGWRRVRGRDVAMIFQEPLTALDPVFTVGRQLTGVIRRHGAPAGPAARRRAARLLADVGLPDPEQALNRYPHELSGGMRQRVLIAMALACTPRVLVADEPTSALDVTTEAQILELLERQVRGTRTALLLVTHDLRIVRRLCDRALVMHRGRIVEHGTVPDLLERPHHPHTAALVAAASAKRRHRPERPPDLTRDGTSEPLLEIRTLGVAYRPRGRSGVAAVRDVSLTLRPGRILAIVGESGCGKTSLARAVLGLNRPAAGSLRFRGRELAGLPPRERRDLQRQIQHVFQDPAASLSPRRTIRQTLEEPLALYRRVDRADWPRRMRDALGTVGLDDSVLQRLPHQLSGGQRQRIALARALIAEPALIVADEPMSALDPPARARIGDLLCRVRDELGVAFLLIAHDIGIVRRLADEVAVMYLGGIVEQGAAHNLFDRPAHPYTQALLAAAAAGETSDPERTVLAGEPPSPLTPPAGCVFHTRCPRVIERCRRHAPPETRIHYDRGETVAHQVRCHLCTET